MHGPSILRSALVGFVLLSSFSAPARSESAGEAQLKAAFVYHFTQFVEWPPEAAPPQPGNPITICTIGNDSLGSALSDSLREKKVRDRGLVIKHLKNTQLVGSCNVLFISNSESKRLADILESATTGNILTVGETPGFLKHGGCIEFLVDSNRIHFNVNLSAARKAGLHINSELLSLADTVEK